MILPAAQRTAICFCDMKTGPLDRPLDESSPDGVQYGRVFYLSSQRSSVRMSEKSTNTIYLTFLVMLANYLQQRAPQLRRNSGQGKWLIEKLGILLRNILV